MKAIPAMFFRGILTGSAVRFGSAVALPLIAFCVPGSLFSQHPASNFADSKLPPRAREQLEKQAVAMAAIRIEYRDDRVVFIPTLSRASTTCSVVFKASRFYQRLQFQSLTGNQREKNTYRTHEEAFDGKILYFGDPERPTGERPGVLAKYLVDDTTDPDHKVRNLTSFPYLDAAGFYVPNSIAALKTFTSIQPLVLYYLNESDSNKVERVGENLHVTVRVTDLGLIAAQEVDLEKHHRMLKGSATSPDVIAKEMEAVRKMQQMTPKRVVAFVLDPKLGYGVVEREEFTFDGQRIGRIQADQWKYYDAAGIWLPGRCVGTYYMDRFAPIEYSDRPRLITTNQLERVEFGPPANIPFALDYRKRGSLIRDRTSPEARASPHHEVSYFVPAHGAELRRLTGDLGAEMGRGRVPYSFSFILVLIGLHFIVLLIRHKTKSRKG